MRPSATSDADHVAHLVHARRIEPVHRLVQDQQLRDRRSGTRRRRAAAACPSSTSTPGHRRGAGSRPAPATRRCDSAPPARAPPPAPAGSACRSDGRGTAARRRSPPTRASAMSRCFGTAWPSSDIEPASAWVNPSSTRISVVLPAPFGPRYPNAHPRGIRRSTPLTATLTPNRFVNPRVSTAHVWSTFCMAVEVTSAGPIRYRAPPHTARQLIARTGRYA